MVNLIPRVKRADLAFPLQRHFDGLMNDFFGKDLFSGFSRESYPRMDVVRENGKMLFRYTVPGVKAEDIEVNIHPDNTLEVSGSLSSDYKHDQNNYLIHEMTSSKFTRRVRLPEGVEGEPVANLKDGVLSLEFNVQKEEEKEQVKKISVQVS